MQARHTNMKWWFLTCSLLICLLRGAPLRAETGGKMMKLQSGVAAKSLLELYTSEGCSSCPPAEKWFSALTQNDRLWKEVVPVAFHVDYWDYLGWTDPFGSGEFSKRQRAYAQQWRSRSVYTPGFVLNGEEWRRWFGGGQVPEARGEPAGMLTAESADGRHWTVQFDPAKSEGAQSVEFHAVLLGFGMDSKVTAGENRGRVLTHDFVALAHSRVAGSPTDAGFKASLAFPEKIERTPKRYGLAVWVTDGQGSRPLQAVGGWIERL